MEKIEHSSNKERFTLAEIREQVKKSKAFWSSPEGKKRQAELDRENRSRKRMPSRFPELARRNGTTPGVIGEHPSINHYRRKLDLLDR